MPSPPQEQGLHWVFTLNNPTVDDDFGDEVLQHLTYLVVGLETAPTTGTPHYQGYLVLTQKRRLSWLKNHVSARANFRIRRGTCQEAAAYCKKGEQSHEEWKEFGTEGPNYGLNAKVFEHGELPLEQTAPATEKKKRDFKRIIALAKEGKLAEIADEDPAAFVLYYNTIKRIMQDHPLEHEDLPVLDNHWFHGEAGAGKSKAARTRYPGAYKHLPNKWWDGYNQQETVIIEDLDRSTAYHMAHNLKIWADHYPFVAEVKGTSINCRPKRIIVTSNYTPEQLYPNDPELVKAIRRRFIFEEFFVQ